MSLTEAAGSLPKQSRSRARRAAMIALGGALLNDRDFESVSVAEITSALGFSTGSFYSAFSDKTAFFVAVQQDVNATLGAAIASELEIPAVRAMTPAERFSLCVDFSLRYLRSFGGVIRSALRYESRIPEAWEPHRRSGQRMTAALVDGLAPHDAERMSIAIQIAFGTMINAMLHDPGPLRLGDQSFADEMKRALTPYLEATRN